jgi:Heliorhodopsin
MKKKITLQGLRKFNLIMGALHAVQAFAVLAIADGDKGWFPVSTSFLSFNNDSKKLDIATRNIGDVQLAYLVAGFFALSAIAHFVIATVYRKRYETDLAKGINKARWIEYALSASVMMVGISFLSGIYDLSSLIMIFALDAVMNLMGLVMELWNQKSAEVKKLKEVKDVVPTKINWLSYWIGCYAGIIPWIVFAIYVTGSTLYSSKGIPGFVYGIYISMFIFFNSFALNMFLQYRAKGRWANYLYGERVYIILSLVAKSALAWQVFAGALRP